MVEISLGMVEDLIHRTEVEIKQANKEIEYHKNIMKVKKDDIKSSLKIRAALQEILDEMITKNITKENIEKNIRKKLASYKWITKFDIDFDFDFTTITIVVIPKVYIDGFNKISRLEDNLTKKYPNEGIRFRVFSTEDGE